MGNKNKWDNLSIKDKSNLMQLYINNGVTDLNKIKNLYNEGGELNDNKESNIDFYTLFPNFDYSKLQSQSPNNIQIGNDGNEIFLKQHYPQKFIEYNSIIKSPLLINKERETKSTDLINDVFKRLGAWYNNSYTMKRFYDNVQNNKDAEYFYIPKKEFTIPIYEIVKPRHYDRNETIFADDFTSNLSLDEKQLLYDSYKYGYTDNFTHIWSKDVLNQNKKTKETLNNVSNILNPIDKNNFVNNTSTNIFYDDNVIDRSEYIKKKELLLDTNTLGGINYINHAILQNAYNNLNIKENKDNKDGSYKFNKTTNTLIIPENSHHLSYPILANIFTQYMRFTPQEKEAEKIVSEYEDNISENNLNGNEIYGKIMGFRIYTQMLPGQVVNKDFLDKHRVELKQLNLNKYKDETLIHLFNDLAINNNNNKEININNKEFYS